MKVLILTNGYIPNNTLVQEEYKNTEYTICVDGAALWAKEYSIMPDMIVGDFDSVGEDILAYFHEGGVHLRKYPREKDETDTQIAVDIAIKTGADEICILGGMGTRFDHSFGNVLLLIRMASRGIKARIIDNHNEIFVSNAAFTIEGNVGETVSVLPLNGSVYISRTEGLYYPIQDKILPMDFPFGISNIMTGKHVFIEILSGWALIIRAKD